MYLYHNIENDHVINIEQIHYRQQMIDKIKKRFLTYGYREIYTSVFEQYDLYATMNGTVNHHEMIKTIDKTGQVLVLRPDVTIPLTQQIAKHTSEISQDLRYFYVLDVYRQIEEAKEYRERTQAGVEYFGNSSPEADAEIIALAIHLLHDIKVKNVKIELGHAGFFKHLVGEMNLQSHDLKELKQLIQAKNITEIEQFLKQLSIPKEILEIVASLPLLYGKPENILKQAEKLPLTDKLKETLQNINEIYHVLDAYGVQNHVVIDLSLINHMDYYSDMIFQGFIEKVGKPILMGGRYNTLANQFNANIPAIGFACDIDFLLAGVEKNALSVLSPIDILLLYDKTFEKEALQLATFLRNNHYEVLSYVDSPDNNRMTDSKCIIQLKNKTQYVVKIRNEKKSFTSHHEVLTFLQQVRERK